MRTAVEALRPWWTLILFWVIGGDTRRGRICGRVMSVCGGGANFSEQRKGFETDRPFGGGSGAELLSIHWPFLSLVECASVRSTRMLFTPTRDAVSFIDRVQEWCRDEAVRTVCYMQHTSIIESSTCGIPSEDLHLWRDPFFCDLSESIMGLKGTYVEERLQKVAQSGICTRGACEEMIKDGRVLVSDDKRPRHNCHLDPFL